MEKPFLIYRSSAGSGKTYTLALSYLRLALSQKGHFKKILGVTFTNKATEEMKQRIVKFLSAISKEQDDKLSAQLCYDLQLTPQELKSRAKDTLTDILHQYSRFSIVTIDSFFHQVIRSFAREMGLQGTFTIDLDTDAIMQQVIDELLTTLQADEKSLLKEWLTQYAEERVEAGQPWDIRRDMLKLAKEILKDDFKAYALLVNQLSNDNSKLQEIKESLDAIKYSFENEIKSKCKEGLDLIAQNGLEIGSFKSKGNGPAGLFIKLQKLELEISERRREAADNLEAWINKTDKQKDFLEQLVGDSILPVYNEVLQYFDENLVQYNSACEVRRYLFTFGILGYINSQLQSYREENDVMLISDLPDFLSKIIDDSDTPFIYEKVGSRFDHYLIDEFQDTSAFQWSNFKPLVKNATDQGQFSMVVGDAKQSIYRFRGGDWQLLQNNVAHDIGTELSNAQELNTNWRSHEKVVSFNNHLFANLNGTIEKYFEGFDQSLISRAKELISLFDEAKQILPENNKKQDGLVEIGFIDEVEDKKKEAIRRTIEKVEELQDQGYALRDIAILTRRASEGRLLARAFIEYGGSPEAKANLRYDVVSKEALYLSSSQAVQFLVSVIRWLNNEKDLVEHANWFSKFLRHLRTESNDDAYVFSVVKQWQQIVPEEFVQKINYFKTLPLYELVEELIRIFEVGKLKAEYTYLQGFQDAVLEFSKNERGDIASFLVWWEEVRKDRSILIADDNDAIKILTIHKSKGLEFPVVIIPFLNWALDENEGGNRDNILWCEPVDQAPFNLMPVVPLKYGRILKETYWASVYLEEKVKNLVDSLNLLYVALTRPENALYIFSEAMDNGKIKTVGDLLLQTIKESEKFKDSQYVYGKLPVKQNAPMTINEFGLQKYHSAEWRDKLSVQLKESIQPFNKAAAEGIDLHEELSDIISAEDLNKFSDHAHYKLLKATVSDLSEFFDGSWKVQNEVPLLLPNGDMRRLDRLNSKANETVIIDYKTGQERGRDKNQLEQYIKLIRESGVPAVRGVLYYLDSKKIVEVS